MRLGNQVPTFESTGEYASSTGAELCAAWREWGTAFYPSQEHEMELFTARDSDNRFASKTIGVSKPRQNGKSFAARKYATTMGAAGKRCLYSAHNGSTVRQMFKYIKDGDYVYFVHSYAAMDCGEAVIADTEYGAYLTAAVANGNVFGCQFYRSVFPNISQSVLCDGGKIKFVRKMQIVLRDKILQDRIQYGFNLE